jgi:hypothetical protein
MTSILGEWRKGKVRPIQGNAPHDRLVSRGVISPRNICDDPFHATRFPQLQVLPGPSVGVFQAWRNLSGPMGFQNQNQLLGRDHTASRWSAPGPGQRTRREDHALSHRPQMSSGRLFLDRVGRHQSPSPLHRRSQNNTQSPDAQAKHDISTLPGRRHFYFALTVSSPALWQQSENVVFEQSRNVVLTAPNFGDAGRTTTDDASRERPAGGAEKG